ncbi:MAG: hypothetical protein QWI36_01290 [Wolbachia endosymbiont of Tyrophagus putrescentiae]|nr:hypothetical protein [Wolbachia endosymbiont of Tyrophagus putrescentiae]
MNEIDFIDYNSANSNYAIFEGVHLLDKHFEIAAYSFYEDTGIHSLCGGITDDNNNQVGIFYLHLLPVDSYHNCSNSKYVIDGYIEGDISSLLG